MSEAFQTRGEHSDEEIQSRIQELAEEDDGVLGDIARRYLVRQEESA